MGSFRTKLLIVGTLLCAAPAGAMAADPGATGRKLVVEQIATGQFDVQLTPISTADAAVGSLSIAKTFHGGLEGKSTGQMLAVQTTTKGSAGYVAMEVVTGTLEGRQGSFALQHSGTMNRGAPSLIVTVVPDSGTGALEGLAGSLEIRTEGGQHYYSFRYSLPPTQ